MTRPLTEPEARWTLAAQVALWIAFALFGARGLPWIIERLAYASV